MSLNKELVALILRKSFLAQHQQQLPSTNRQGPSIPRLTSTTANTPRGSTRPSVIALPTPSLLVFSSSNLTNHPSSSLNTFPIFLMLVVVSMSTASLITCPMFSFHSLHPPTHRFSSPLITSSILLRRCQERLVFGLKSDLRPYHHNFGILILN
eukprot:PhF_6_TR35800/c0_g1_i1/m.52031